MRTNEQIAFGAPPDAANTALPYENIETNGGQPFADEAAASRAKQALKKRPDIVSVTVTPYNLN
jgi:hypothetical protein